MCRMTNEIGFIQIHRQLLNWEWYSDIPVRLTFLHLLIIANWEDKEWKGILIKRGQVVVGRKKLSKEIGISEQQLRTSLIKLKSTQEITIKSTNKYSVITLVKYNNYQDKRKLSTNKKTIKQPTNNQQSTTTKEDNKVISKELNKKNSQFNFRKSLVDYGFKEELVIDWLKVRKTKKASNTKTAFNGFIKQVEFSNLPINEILNECVNRSWAGFKNEWLKKETESAQLTATEKLNKALGM